jgi:hypothetical protein
MPSKGAYEIYSGGWYAQPPCSLPEVVGERFDGQVVQILGAAEHRSGMYQAYM